SAVSRRSSGGSNGESKRKGKRAEKRAVAISSSEEAFPGHRYSALCGVCGAGGGRGGGGVWRTFSRNPALAKRIRPVSHVGAFGYGRSPPGWPRGSGGPAPRTERPAGAPAHPAPSCCAGGRGPGLRARAAPGSPAPRPRRPRPLEAPPPGGPAPGRRLRGSGRRGLAGAPSGRAPATRTPRAPARPAPSRYKGKAGCVPGRPRPAPCTRSLRPRAARQTPAAKMVKQIESKSLSEKYSNVVFLEVDVDDCQDVASECEVKCMPTFQFFKKGQKVGEFSGANKEKLEATINELI
uniref:Thioredoxin n=1 Tax=Canis lupus familiaris TaxID=9615 RepID=A0A8C0N102_CANLF